MPQLFSITFFIILFTSLIAFANGKVSGVVKDKMTLEPLIGANVILLNTTLGAATDINGYFEIRFIPAGTYDVRVSYIGYTYKIKSKITIKDSKTAFVNFKLDKDTTLDVKVLDQQINLPKPDSTRPWSVDRIPIRGLDSLSKKYTNSYFKPKNCISGQCAK